MLIWITYPNHCHGSYLLFFLLINYSRISESKVRHCQTSYANYTNCIKIKWWARIALFGILFDNVMCCFYSLSIQSGQFASKWCNNEQSIPALWVSHSLHSAGQFIFLALIVVLNLLMTLTLLFLSCRCLLITIFMEWIYFMHL